MAYYKPKMKSSGDKASPFQVKVFWVVMPCSILVGYQCFTSLHPVDGGSMDL
jgi:hypothetical protein